MPIEIVNFGCRLNINEGEAIRAKALEAGMEHAVIFNSCAVTGEAERQVRQHIRRLRREQPDAKIIVTGCSAQLHPEDYAGMQEVDHVLGNHDKLKPESYASLRGAEGDAAIQSTGLAGLLHSVRNDKRVIVNDIMSVRETAGHIVSAFDGRVRGFVQVQNGCDHRCTFCIIPFGRGPSRSVPVGDIVTQVRALAAQGVNEVVLTGVDVSDYGKDLPGSPTLGAMMKRLLKLVPELPRLRLSSIDAVEVDGDILDLLANEKRLMPHLHLSLQAGDDMILKRMKRRHLRGDILRFCEEVRRLRPDIVFGADIIAGFPTEDEAMFENTLAIVEEAGLTYLHVFPYSARKGTPAARMPQVAKQLRKERAARLRDAGGKQVAAFLQAQVGKVASVLVEHGGTGRSEHFCEVAAEGHAPGSIVPMRITGVEPASLRAAGEAIQ